MRQVRTISTLVTIGSLAAGIVIVDGSAAFAASAYVMTRPIVPPPPAAQVLHPRYVAKPPAAVVRDHRYRPQRPGAAHNPLPDESPAGGGRQRVVVRDHRDDPVCLGKCHWYDIFDPF